MGDPETFEVEQPEGVAREAPKRNTLVIVLIVVGCLFGLVVLGGVLLAVVGPHLWSAAFDSKVSAAETQMANFEMAIDNYRLMHRSLPDSLEDLTKTSERVPHPFLQQVPADPWGNEYEYRRLGRKEYRIRSAGEDGMLDTGDDVVWPRDD